MLLFLPTLRNSDYRSDVLSLLMKCDDDFRPPLSSTRLVDDVFVTKEERLMRYLNEKDMFHQYLLYIENNEVIGLMNFVLTWDSFEVDTLCVHPKFRNKGIAKSFYDYFSHTLVPTFNTSKITVECNKKAYAHIHLLKSLDFQSESETDTHVSFVKLLH